MTVAAFSLMAQQKYMQFTLGVLIAIQIHGSAIIMLSIVVILQG